MCLVSAQMEIIPKPDEEISIVLVLQTDELSYTFKWTRLLQNSKLSPVTFLEYVNGQSLYNDKPNLVLKKKVYSI